MELPRGRVALTLAVLLALMFSKFFYMASMSSYYIFYLMDKFHLPVQSAQLHLFVFFGAVAVGTLAGGPIGDRFGRKVVIWVSILGVLPFTLALPYANLFWTGVLSVFIGVILASAFPAIVVYAQELLPARVGTVAGMSFGFAFGMGGIGAAVLGHLADVNQPCLCVSPLLVSARYRSACHFSAAVGNGIQAADATANRWASVIIDGPKNILCRYGILDLSGTRRWKRDLEIAS